MKTMNEKNVVASSTDEKGLQDISQEDIQHRIYTIRGVQVMLDRDLAPLYQVTTGRLNEAVKRNKDCFPDDFMFQLTDAETENWKSQIAITNSIKMGLRHNPYAFTEEGVSQLSHILKSKIAVEMSIRITRAFVAMRKFIINNAGIFQRLEAVELKQISTDKKIDQILDRLDDGSLKAKLGIFFDGQMFDAFVLVEELIQKATRRIVLIIDDTVYHFGASLKDLGKKWFSVDVITEHTADDLIARL